MSSSMVSHMMRGCFLDPHRMHACARSNWHVGPVAAHFPLSSFQVRQTSCHPVADLTKLKRRSPAWVVLARMVMAIDAGTGAVHGKTYGGGSSVSPPAVLCFCGGGSGTCRCPSRTCCCWSCFPVAAVAAAGCEAAFCQAAALGGCTRTRPTGWMAVEAAGLLGLRSWNPVPGPGASVAIRP